MNRYQKLGLFALVGLPLALGLGYAIKNNSASEKKSSYNITKTEIKEEKMENLERLITRYKQNIKCQGKFCQKFPTSLEDLKEYYKKHSDTLSITLKNQFPEKTDWNKFKDNYKNVTDIIIEECGDGTLKEWQILKEIRESEGKELKEKIPRLIVDVYGSIDNYADFGKDLQECSEKLNYIIEGLTFEETIVKRFFKQIPKCLNNAGEEIIAACEEIKATGM